MVETIFYKVMRRSLSEDKSFEQRLRIGIGISLA